MIFSYLELGTNTVWVQMVVATLVTVPFFLRDQISRGMSKLRRRDGAVKTQPPGEDG